MDNLLKRKYEIKFRWFDNGLCKEYEGVHQWGKFPSRRKLNKLFKEVSGNIGSEKIQNIRLLTDERYITPYNGL